LGREELDLDRLRNTIVCRCRDVTLADVERVIREGCTDIECIRKVLGIGMGPCQGRTCIPLLMRYLARRLGKRIDELRIPTSRPPVVPIEARYFLSGGDD